MKVTKINEKLSKIKLEEETKSSILDLIDEKVESDMREVLNKMDVLTNAISGIKSELKTENQSLKSELKTENQSLKSELKTENQSLKSELKTENQSIRNEIKIVYWVIGIATAIIGLMIAFKK